MLSHAGLLAWALPFFLVGIPALLMGGTFPAAVRSVSGESRQVAAPAGWVYAVNTAGGIGGALLSSFLLLGWLDIRGTALAAATFNLVAAGMAFLLSRAVSRPGKLHHRQHGKLELKQSTNCDRSLCGCRRNCARLRSGLVAGFGAVP
jgi:hypothetical protein